MVKSAWVAGELMGNLRVKPLELLVDAKIGDCLREAEETGYWLELLADSRALSPSQSALLLDECRQLIAILVTILKRSKESP